MKTFTSRQLIGGSLVILGVSILLANLLKAVWLIAAVTVFIAIVTALYGVKKGSSTAFLLALALITIAYLICIFWALDSSSVELLGIAFLGTGCLLLLGLAGSQFATSIRIPWLSIPAGLFIGLGASFLFTPLSFLDLVFSIGLSLGIALLLWSSISNYYGLMITGAIVSSHSVSVAISWQYIDQGSDALVRVGIMLLLFALGWALISLLSGFYKKHKAWWPLIPAAVLSVTGWGLFIGGNPESSKMFLGNTGSFALIILGLYVLLLKSGLNKN
jgi:hypothetical protein